MAFSFGSNQPTFGSPANKPTGFGTAFQAPTSAPSTGFSLGTSFGSTTTPAFGTTSQTSAFGVTSQTPAFGATSQTPAFGATSQTPAFGATTSQPPAFGSTFGTPSTNFNTFGAPTTSAPAFGSFGSNTAATSSAPAFGTTFGSTTSGGLFGSTAATTKPSLFGAPTSTTPSLFSTPGSGLFGTTTTTTSQTPGLFGNLSSSTPGLFGGTSAATTTTAAPSLFGTSFGSGGTTGLFGSTATTQPSLFGGFGSNTVTGSSGFTGFGATSSAPLFGGSTFGAKPPELQQQIQSADTHLQQILTSFYAVNIFNDERDDIIKKWNMLQACWGTGKGYYGQNSHVQYSNTNPLYRFKAVGYNIIIEADNSEGLVKLTLNKKESEIRSQKDSITTGLSGILGNKPNLTVLVDNIRSINENQTELTIVVTEKGVTGTTRKIPATDLANYLNQPNMKQQLSCVGLASICAYLTPSKSELEEYLSKPPPGIDNQMWEAAKADNPNPKKYMPVAINGFTDLKNRMHNQEYETGLHKAFLQKVDKDISELRKKHASSIAQITDLKQKFLQLQHRILRILVKQECTRKIGFTITPEEELLKGRLETLNAHLNTPTQFKGQLIELMSCIKTVGNLGQKYNEHYNIDPQVQEDIKQFLQMEQHGISHLINIINNDLLALKTISDGMNQFIKHKNVMKQF